MRRLSWRVVVPLVLLLAIALYALVGGGQGGGRLVDAQGRRVIVADGDSFKVWGETIRLAGIDAVERAQFCMDGQGGSWSCGQSAREALEAVIAHGGLRCVTVATDRYGWTIARCTTAGGDVAAAMISGGWAVSTSAAYAAQEQVAREAKRGIWAGTFEVPSVWRERNKVVPKKVDIVG